MHNTAPAIEIRSVSKSFGAFDALSDVSLSVEKGLFVTLLGPSGCGKSTLLRAVAGLCTPDRGEIFVDGRNITNDPPHNRPAKIVFQDYALFPHMDIRTNVGFGCEMLGMPKDAISRRTTELLNLIQLPDIGGRLPAELSGGQRQRVALARALAPDPGVLLLDEPLGALDLRLRLQMQKELKDIQRKTKKTFVFVTHDQEEAMSMSDRIAVMNAGRIEQLGTPRDIYANPVNLFVAGFVGAANVFRGKVKAASGDQLVIEVDGDRWLLPAARVTSPVRPGVGSQVAVVIRPRDILPGPGDRDGALSLSGRVRDRTFLGDRVQIEFVTKGGAVTVLDTHPSAVSADDAMTAHCRVERVALIADPDPGRTGGC